MIVVLDTNVLVSGLLFGGPPNQLVDAALEGRYLLVTSRDQLSELRRVLGYKKLARFVDEPDRIVALIGEIAEVVEPTIIPRLCRESDDDRILAVGITASAHILVSGDDDLLSIGTVDGTRVVSPREALALVSGSGR